MKLALSELRKLIKSNLLLEDSEQVFAQFVYDMEELVKRAGSFKQETIDDVVAHQPPEEQEQVRQRLYKLRDKAHGSVLSKYPNVNPEDIKQILTRARQKSDSDGSSYADNVISFTRNYWSSNITQGGSFATADPESRGAGARSIDNILKQSWKTAASEYPEFWESFEVFHAVGGVTGAADNVDVSTALNFYKQYRDSADSNELSCYGWSGDKPTTSNSLNPGIKGIINSNTMWREQKFHFSMLGDITFAGSHDILTQWLKLKPEDQENFEKSGDFTRIISGGTKDIIAGPDDELLSGQDFYNEIILDNWQVGDYVVVPTIIDDIMGKRSSQRISQLLANGMERLGKTGQFSDLTPLDIVMIYSERSGADRSRDAGIKGYLNDVYHDLLKPEDSFGKDYAVVDFMFELHNDGVVIFNPKGEVLNNDIAFFMSIDQKIRKGFEGDRKEIDKIVLRGDGYYKKYIDELRPKIKDMLRSGQLFVKSRRSGYTDPLSLEREKAYQKGYDAAQTNEQAIEKYSDPRQIPSLYFNDPEEGVTQLMYDLDKLFRVIELSKSFVPKAKQVPPSSKKPENPVLYWAYKEDLDAGKKQYGKSQGSDLVTWINSGGESTSGDILVWNNPQKKWFRPKNHPSLKPLFASQPSFADRSGKAYPSRQLRESKMYENIIKELLKI